MSKHTEGRWIAADYGDYKDYDGKCRVVLGENGDIRTAVVLGFDTEENQANANLIAAAPELLAALNAMMTHMGMDEDEWNKPTFDQARKAIAKAEGME